MKAKAENEFRVRAVRRFVVTHFQSDGKGASCSQYGEFPNIRQAVEVGRALAASVPGATFATIEEQGEPLYEVYAYTPEQADALKAFIRSDAYPSA